MDFEEFWKGYPRRLVKKPSRDQWNKLTEEQQRLAIEALPNHVAMWESEGREPHSCVSVHSIMLRPILRNNCILNAVR